MRAAVWNGRNDVRVDSVPEAPAAYETFQKNQDGAVKVVFNPEELQ